MYAVPISTDADEATFRAAARALLCAGACAAEHCVRRAGRAVAAAAAARSTRASRRSTVPRAYRRADARRDLPQRAGPLRACSTTCCGASSQASAICSSARPTRMSRKLIGLCACGPPRHPQDARLPALPANDGRRRALYTAWFEPHHYILKRAVPFFVDRFAQDGLADRDAASARAAGRTARCTIGPPARDQPRPPTTCARRAVAHLLSPRPSIRRGCASRRMINRRCRALLAQHAGDRAYSRYGARGADSASSGMMDDGRRPARAFRRTDCARAGAQVEPDEPAEGSIAAMRARSRALHALPALQGRDADGVRRRAARRAGGVRRRAAGRPGRPRRQAVRRARPGKCSTARWRKPGSTAAASTSPTR